MEKASRKSAKITINKLAIITQREFVAVRSEMADEFTTVRKEMINGFTNIRQDLTEKLDEKTVEILQAIDDLVTHFDAKEKEKAAHTVLHKEISDTLHDHDLRLKKIKTK